MTPSAHIAASMAHGRSAGARLMLAALLLPLLLLASPALVSAATADEPTAQARVDVNRASAAELEALPGIGPALAGRIIARRDEKGAFSSIAELLEIKGIGPRLLSRLEDRIIVKEGDGPSRSRKKSATRGRGR